MDSTCSGVGRLEKAGAGGRDSGNGDVASEKWGFLRDFVQCVSQKTKGVMGAGKKMGGVSTWWVSPVAPKEGLVY
jgi:hypothetical protein